MNTVSGQPDVIGGTGVSAGIAVGRAHRVTAIYFARSGELLADETAVAASLEAFDRAVAESVTEVESLAEIAGRPLNEEEQAIADTQVEFLTDPQLRENVTDKIVRERKTAPDAVLETIDELVEQFSSMEDEYLRARAADIADIGQRIALHLGATGKAHTKPAAPGSILVADDISPSEAIALDLSAIAGFVTKTGGRTSHTALLARAKKIPAVVGCGPSLDAIAHDEMLILNGGTGEVIRNPDPETLTRYIRLQQQESRTRAERGAAGRKTAQTGEGSLIRLMLNIAGPEDMDSAEAAMADGVGLYRTEMLYLRGSHFPDEETQFTEYRKVMEKAGDRPVIFRTMDIGGDKPLPYFPFPAEQNPFLGYRAIRFSLDRRDIFLTQLRAILRAAAGGDAGIMFPMISSLSECRSAKELLEQAKSELEKEGIAFNASIRAGIMIEIPAAAIIADLLAKEVDFFSIGTNDLCQYTLAVDRMNEKISDLYNPFHPALLRLIRQIIEAGHRQGIPVGMCGEMAGDPMATKLLLALGLKEFSMSAPSIPDVHDIIGTVQPGEVKKINETVSGMGEAAAIIAYLQSKHS